MDKCYGMNLIDVLYHSRYVGGRGRQLADSLIKKTTHRVNDNQNTVMGEIELGLLRKTIKSTHKTLHTNKEDSFSSKLELSSLLLF